MSFENPFADKKEEIKEPENQVETRRATGIEIDEQTGVVVTKKEAEKERKEKFGDPTRFRDLR